MTDISVTTLLGLKKPPIAIGFLDSAPEGIEPWSGGPVPAGCFFWKKAQEARVGVQQDGVGIEHCHGDGQQRVPPQRPLDIGPTRPGLVDLQTPAEAEQAEAVEADGQQGHHRRQGQFVEHRRILPGSRRGR